MASAVHPPPRPPLALLRRPRVVEAVADDDHMDDSDTESIAESCPHPRPHGADAAATDSSSSFSCGSSACCHEYDDAEMDDDGCSSCVEGDEWSSYQEQDEAAGDEEERNKAGRGCGAWWEQMAVAGARGGAIAALPLPLAPEAAEDPKRAAERQEEDRKFWEDCLASGYP